MEVVKIYEHYKVEVKDDRIFDPIRQIWLHTTPEEIVRQKTIKFLTGRLKVPKNHIIVERSLGTLGVKGSKKRIDIGILDDDNLLMAIVECKAPQAYNAEKAFKQAQGYLRDLNTRYFFVTDGRMFDGFYYDTIEDIHLETIPKYDRWYYYPSNN